MKSDIEIARSIELKKVKKITVATLQRYPNS